MIKTPVQMYKAFVIATLASLTPLVAQACFNDENYKYFSEGKDRDCRNIRINDFRRKQLCPIPEVADNCPQTCGKCCVDKLPEQYQFILLKKDKTVSKGEEKKGCDWIDNPSKKEDYCKKWSQGYMIRDQCPSVCDFCQEAVLVRPPTPAPTKVPVVVPTKPPSKITTPDPTKSPTKEPTSTPTKPPTEMPTASPTKSPTSSPTKSPTANPTGKPTAKATNTPTKNPTKAPTVAPTKNPTTSPTKSPTVSPTKSPTKSPTVSPSKRPTESPTMSSAKPTIECKDDPNYLFGQSDNKSCVWIAKQQTRRKRYCANVETYLACPRVCGVCCKDDPDFILTTEIDTRKKCGWIGENNFRKKRYCGEENNGRSVKEACPEACNDCPDYISVAPSRSPRN